jgi:NAD+ synthase (glutamine-hydrolysing)
MYSSPESFRDAEDVARRLGVDLTEIPITHVFEAYQHALSAVFAGTEPDVTEENLQARIRGNYLMAMSNKFGSMVLATGNKSEYAVGYATLYGDMAGGFAPIKDVPKTLVYELCRWRNASTPGSPAIPEAILDKPPSAELRPDQRDTDSLPPYDVLDPMIHAYVEEDRSPEEMIAGGMDADTVRRIVLMIDRAEYKRRQAAPGIKITPKAFGRDRRIPITNRYGLGPSGERQPR